MLVGTAYVEIRPDTKGFAAQAESGILGSVGGIARKAAGIFAGAFVLKQGADFLGGLIGDAEESRRVLAETEQAIRATGGAARITAPQVAALADVLSKKTGIDDEAVQSASNLLLTFKDVRNEVGKGNDIFNQATAAVLDLSKQFGGTEASAVQIGKALNDPVKGVTALTRVGVQFTEQQKDQIKVLVESGKTLEAQKIILGEINAQVGGQAAAQATATDKLRVVFGNLREELGARLLPIVDRVATFLGDKLPGALDKVGAVAGPVIREIAGGIRALVAAFKAGDGDITSSGFAGFLEHIGLVARRVFDFVSRGIRLLLSGFREGNVSESEGIAGVIVTIGTVARTVFETLRRIIPPVFEFLRDNAKPILIALAIAFSPITVAAVAVVGGLIALYNRFEAVRTVVAGVIDAVGKVADFLATSVAPRIAAFASYVSQQFENLVAFVDKHWNDIASAIGRVLDVVFGVIETFTSLARAVWDAWGDELIAIVKIAFDFIRDVVELGVNVVRGIILAVTAIINGDWGKAWDAIKSIVEAAMTFAQATVANAMRLIGQIIEGAMSAIRLVWDAGWNGLRGVVATVVQFVLDTFLGFVETFLGLAAKAFGFLPIIGPKLKEAAGAVAGFRDEVNEYLDGIRDKTVNVDTSAAAQNIRNLLALIDLVRFGGNQGIPTSFSDETTSLPDRARGAADGPLPGPKGKALLVRAHGGEWILTADEFAALTRRSSTAGGSAVLGGMSVSGPLVGSLNVATTGHPDDARRAILAALEDPATVAAVRATLAKATADRRRQVGALR